MCMRQSWDICQQVCRPTPPGAAMQTAHLCNNGWRGVTLNTYNQWIMQLMPLQLIPTQKLLHIMRCDQISPSYLIDYLTVLLRNQRYRITDLTRETVTRIIQNIDHCCRPQNGWQGKILLGGTGVNNGFDPTRIIRQTQRLYPTRRGGGLVPSDIGTVRRQRPGGRRPIWRYRTSGKRIDTRRPGSSGKRWRGIRDRKRPDKGIELGKTGISQRRSWPGANPGYNVNMKPNMNGYGYGRGYGQIYGGQFQTGIGFCHNGWHGVTQNMYTYWIQQLLKSGLFNRYEIYKLLYCTRVTPYYLLQYITMVIKMRQLQLSNKMWHILTTVVSHIDDCCRPGYGWPDSWVRFWTGQLGNAATLRLGGAGVGTGVGAGVGVGVGAGLGVGGGGPLGGGIVGVGDIDGSMGGGLQLGVGNIQSSIITGPPVGGAVGGIGGGGIVGVGDIDGSMGGGLPLGVVDIRNSKIAERPPVGLGNGRGTIKGGGQGKKYQKFSPNLNKRHFAVVDWSTCQTTTQSVVPTIIYTQWMNQIRTLKLLNQKDLCESLNYAITKPKSLIDFLNKIYHKRRSQVTVPVQHEYNNILQQIGQYIDTGYRRQTTTTTIINIPVKIIEWREHVEGLMSHPTVQKTIFQPMLNIINGAGTSEDFIPIIRESKLLMGQVSEAVRTDLYKLQLDIKLTKLKSVLSYLLMTYDNMIQQNIKRQLSQLVYLQVFIDYYLTILKSTCFF